LLCDRQTGQTPLSIAERLDFTSAANLLMPVTSRKAVLPPQPAQDAALLIVEPEMMVDPVSLDSEDEKGTPLSPSLYNGIRLSATYCSFIDPARMKG